MNAQEVLSAYPCGAVLLPTALANGGDVLPAISTSYGAELLWLLERLRNGVTVRINCGGGRYESTSGSIWGRDRFSTGGQLARVRSEIRETTDEVLYQRQRWYTRRGLELSGYRIPLPQGRYRVTLHFAEIVSAIDESGQRVFDVFLEGKSALQAFDTVAEAGVLTTVSREFSTTVDDGSLDVGLVYQVNFPTVAGIEVEPLR